LQAEIASRERRGSSRKEEGPIGAPTDDGTSRWHDGENTVRRNEVKLTIKNEPFFVKWGRTPISSQEVAGRINPSKGELVPLIKRRKPQKKVSFVFMELRAPCFKTGERKRSPKMREFAVGGGEPSSTGGESLLAIRVGAGGYARSDEMLNDLVGSQGVGKGEKRKSRDHHSGEYAAKSSEPKRSTLY